MLDLTDATSVLLSIIECDDKVVRVHEITVGDFVNSWLLLCRRLCGGKRDENTKEVL